jgi:hypothetical protein
MFISKTELEKIKSQIAFLQDLASKFQSEIIQLRVAQERQSGTLRKGRNWTPEQRQAQSERMKKQQAEAKAKREPRA